MFDLGRVRQCLYYDRETGKFFRKIPVKGFAAGSECGSQRADGRVQIRFDGNRYLRSRLAWFYVYGEWPTEEIDHINGVYSDDRILNLREANRTQQRANSKKSKRNKSGYKGVSWSKKAKKWVAFISQNRKSQYLGQFDNKTAARAAYWIAARDQFGSFARK